MSNNAYTKYFDNNTKSVISQCKISDYYDFSSSNKSHPKFKNCSALWDTGAVVSVISEKLSKDLGIMPTGYTQMVHADGTSTVRTCYINLLLPNNIEIQMLPVLQSNLQDTDFLIGMDVINMCDFAITHKDTNMVFSFDIPSSHLVDYTSL